jgi:hypothetical protein
MTPSPVGFARVLAWLDVGDPDGGVPACYLAKEPLRAPTSSATPSTPADA